ncbi:glycosyltransferase family 4 protein [Demequina lignilytica]|uniref:D-inositol 3-phosphate glycosyltransferase n=1 Tax=Demequina lignilytica TaxID=3051663 RepID=A0AB35MF75_9MICO|nr:glycosyltransferase family 1 protein [Demequina sp. SYSU T0a273]MDN4482429.1 glycosyltransferase family 1 protein [Demequina sp. SYSU T0a273]
MKIALVAESFLPHTNGVTHSLLRVLDHLAARGDDAVVIAPEAPGSPDRVGDAPVVHVPAVGWPGYRDVRVATRGVRTLARVLERAAPDVVHLASPFVLGWAAVRAAAAVRVPSVAVYQTDVPSYAAAYGAPWGEPLLWNRVRSIHTAADLTLAPSTAAIAQLGALGVDRLALWPRGVDTVRFDPSRRDSALRARWAPSGEVVVGYVGRLAPEKRVGDLARIARMPGVRVVVIGEGPEGPRLRRRIPEAQFAGFLGGGELARAVASLDVMVHPGELETFGQSVQEALAAGVPVVAPRSGGPVDLIRHGENGFLYAPGRLDQMAQAVQALVDDPYLRLLMAAHARVSVEGRTWPRVCAALVDHYRAVTAPTGAHR